MRSNRLILAALLGLAVVFAAGLVNLFMLGFKEGSVFPPYSTFRSDPLGARAFHDALQSLEGMEVGRNLGPIEKAARDGDGAMVLLGATRSRDPERTIEALEDFASRGGRLVICFFPVTEDSLFWGEAWDIDLDEEDGGTVEDLDGGTVEGSEEGADEGAEKDSSPGEPWFAKMVSIEDRWEFEYEYYEEGDDGCGADYFAVTAENVSGIDSLPDEAPWRSLMYFDSLGEDWRVIYEWDGHAVVIERDFGGGDIVLMSDSYFASNEAARYERSTGLLAWVPGAHHRVSFDETHLGVAVTPGVMALIRRYNLTWLLFSAIVVAGLFVWKNATSLVPKAKSAGPAEQAEMGGDSRHALVKLLRRSVPAESLLIVCENEWKRSLPGYARINPAKIIRIQAVLRAAAPGRSDGLSPVAAYREIRRIIRERN